MKAHWLVLAAWAAAFLALPQWARAGPVVDASEVSNPMSLIDKDHPLPGPFAGDVVLMDKGDPTNPDDQKNMANWSDVLRFLQVKNKQGKVTDVQLVFISDFDPDDLKRDFGFKNFTLQKEDLSNQVAGPKFLTEEQLLVYKPLLSEPGFESVDQKSQRYYRSRSDQPEGGGPQAIPEPSSVTLAVMGMLGLAGYASRRRCPVA